MPKFRIERTRVDSAEVEATTFDDAVQIMSSIESGAYTPLNWECSGITEYDVCFPDEEY